MILPTTFNDALIVVALFNVIFPEIINASMEASAGETDRDSAATQFIKNCVAYNITEF